MARQPAPATRRDLMQRASVPGRTAGHSAQGAQVYTCRRGHPHDRGQLAHGLGGHLRLGRM